MHTCSFGLQPRLELETQVLGLATVGSHSPPVHREIPRHGYDDFLAPRSAGLGIEQLGLPLFDGAILGLKHA